MIIRKCNKHDSINLLHLLMDIESETNFMLYNKGERKTNKEAIEKFIIEKEKADSPIFLAQRNNEISGYLLVDRGRSDKKRHCMYIVVGVKKSSQGIGIGTKLIEEAISWARQNNIIRIELTVMEHNQRAINLYKKMGFEIEGVKKKSIKMKDKFINEYYMAKII